MSDPDATVPRPRPGTDPLLAQPAEATGLTGEIPQPGDDRPRWVVPVLFVVLAGFVVGLGAIALSRDSGGGGPEGASSAGTAIAGAGDGTTAATPAATGVSDDPSSAPVDVGELPVDAGDRLAEAVDPSVAESEAPPPTPADPVPGSGDPAASSVPPTAVDGIEPGFVRVGAEVVPITSACEGHRPLAPADDSVQVSSYAFRDGDGEPAVVDRRFDTAGQSAVWFAGDVVTGAATGVGDGRAFTASFSTPDGDVDVLVNPAGDTGLGCDSLVVTNEPGQLAFPTTRIVMDVCEAADGGELRGVTSGAGRFAVRAAAEGEPSEISLELPDAGGVLADRDAEAFTQGARRSFSGAVTDGETTLDVTVDLVVGDPSPC